MSCLRATAMELVYNVLLRREGARYHGFLALIIMAIAYINPFWRSLFRFINYL